MRALAVSRSAVTRAAALAASIPALFVVVGLAGSDLPAWLVAVTGSERFAEAALAVLTWFVAYIALLVFGLGFLRGEPLSKFSLRDLSVEFGAVADCATSTSGSRGTCVS
jgi:hypothetical protein